jgi:hypothetical protein
MLGILQKLMQPFLIISSIFLYNKILILNKYEALISTTMEADKHKSKKPIILKIHSFINKNRNRTY